MLVNRFGSIPFTLLVATEMFKSRPPATRTAVVSEVIEFSPAVSIELFVVNTPVARLMRVPDEPPLPCKSPKYLPLDIIPMGPFTPLLAKRDKWLVAMFNINSECAGLPSPFAIQKSTPFE